MTCRLLLALILTALVASTECGPDADESAPLDSTTKQQMEDESITPGVEWSTSNEEVEATTLTTWEQPQFTDDEAATQTSTVEEDSRSAEMDGASSTTLTSDSETSAGTSEDLNSNTSTSSPLNSGTSTKAMTNGPETGDVVGTTQLIDTCRRILILVEILFEKFDEKEFREKLQSSWLRICKESSQFCKYETQVLLGSPRFAQSNTDDSSRTVQVVIHSYTPNADGIGVLVDYSVRVDSNQLDTETLERAMKDNENVKIFQQETNAKFSIVPRDQPDNKKKKDESKNSNLLIILLALLGIFILTVLVILVLVIIKKRSASSDDLRVRYQPCDHEGEYEADFSPVRTNEYTTGDKVVRQSFDNKAFNSSQVEITRKGR